MVFACAFNFVIVGNATFLVELNSQLFNEDWFLVLFPNLSVIETKELNNEKTIGSNFN